MWEGTFCAFVWLNVGCVRCSVCIGAGVFGISVHSRPCDGLFRGRCANGVICVC